MSQIPNQLDELKGFVAELKSDRVAAKEKEQREAWTKYVSLSVVIIAVCAAIATQWAGKYSSRTLASLNDATFYQAQSSDQWSFFQAKSIKQSLFELNRAQFAKEGNAAELAKADEKIARYEKEKKEITEEAKKFEGKRDEARNAAAYASGKGGQMGMAVAVFSISIAIGSICMVTKKKPLWFVSLALAVFAAAQAILAWTR